jgi:hypothetical protein
MCTKLRYNVKKFLHKIQFIYILTFTAAAAAATTTTLALQL